MAGVINTYVGKFIICTSTVRGILARGYVMKIVKSLLQMLNANVYNLCHKVDLFL